MRNLVEKHKILQIEVGSRVYGASTPESDVDLMGVFIAPKRYYLGLDKIEEVDLSVISKHENGRNDKDAIDLKYYELRKFVKLAMENNPNILSSLFTPMNNRIYLDKFGMRLFNNAHLFPFQGLKAKYLGYAFSQKHKMEIKTDNYTGLIKFNDWLGQRMKNPITQEKTSYEYYSNQLLAELREVGSLSGIVKFHEHHALVGDINISLTDKLSKVSNKVKDRLSKVGNREELYTKYGYDTKFGMHLVRLMLEGRELLTTGNLVYPLVDREMLLDIRYGKWTKEDIISYAEELEAEIESLKSHLPIKPRYDEIEKLLIGMVEEAWAI